MKPLLILLILSITLSCFAQENDRAMILKNKVKSVIKMYNNKYFYFNYDEYNKDGLSIMENSFSSVDSCQYRLCKSFYKGTSLVLFYNLRIDTSAFADTTTIKYEYDNKGRMVSYLCLGHMFLYGYCSKFNYIDSFSRNLKSVYYYNIHQNRFQKYCDIISNNGINFYLESFVKYDYTNSDKGIINQYIYHPVGANEELKNTKYLLSGIYTKQTLGDSMICFTKQDCNVDSITYFYSKYCCETEQSGPPMFGEYYIINRYKNNKLYEIINNGERGKGMIQSTRVFYNVNGLISKVTNEFLGMEKEKNIVEPLIEITTTYYNYEYYK